MLRKLLFAVMIILSSFAFTPSSTQAQGTGCAGVLGLDGAPLYETFSINLASAEFEEGDAMSVSSGGVNIGLTITGAASFATSGTTVAYTFAEDGFYTIVITSLGTMDTTLSASCTLGGGGAVLVPNDGRSYDHWLFAIYDKGDGIFEVWGDCSAVNVCQLVAIVNLHLVDEPRQFKDYDGNWNVVVYAVANSGRLVTFQFNVNNGGTLIDDAYRVDFVVQNIPTIGDVASTNSTTVTPVPVGLDTDGDGIIDSLDDCPLISGLPFLNGCVPNALTGSAGLLNLPGENIAANGQCFNIQIVVRVPTNRIPERTVRPSDFPTVGGQFTIFSIEGNVIRTGNWNTSITPSNIAIYNGQVEIEPNSAFASDVSVGIVDDGNDPFEIIRATLTALNSNCSPFSDSSAFVAYASQVGAYGDLVIRADSTVNSCTSTVSGVPIISTSC